VLLEGKSSKFKGVSWSRKARKWTASIYVNGNSKHLGTFSSEMDAALAYDDAAERHFGEFACTNLDLGLITQ